MFINFFELVRFIPGFFPRLAFHDSGLHKIVLFVFDCIGLHHICWIYVWNFMHILLGKAVVKMIKETPNLLFLLETHSWDLDELVHIWILEFAEQLLLCLENSRCFWDKVNLTLQFTHTNQVWTLKLENVLCQHLLKIVLVIAVIFHLHVHLFFFTSSSL